MITKIIFIIELFSLIKCSPKKIDENNLDSIKKSFKNESNFINFNFNFKMNNMNNFNFQNINFLYNMKKYYYQNFLNIFNNNRLIQ